ncbi:MAG TPA: ribonuclease J, partial [Candidatus Polarisedimenticolaceae bacterium]|nr:ribonuclease J [Candidatus Polarisedimenticolaceae bacterium]
MADPSRLEIIPLGGLGEFGMNLMVYRQGADCLVVDCGMMFPGEDHLGVNVVIPDLTFLDGCGRVHGVVLTHGHEDHIGALPYLLARHDVPVYATPYTLGLVRSRLAEHELGGRTLRALPEDGRPLALGPFAVEALPVVHSIPQSRMLVLRTAAGVALHTADFKLDPHPPEGPGTDLRRLAALGSAGVLVLLSDSTNAEQSGFTPSERAVESALEPWIASAPERVIVTTFASHVERLNALGRLAARHGRRVALLGASLETHATVAEELGLLRIPAEARCAAAALASLPRRRAL